MPLNDARQSRNLHRRYLHVEFPVDIHEAFRLACEQAGVSMSSAMEALMYGVLEKRLVLRRQLATLIMPGTRGSLARAAPAEPVEIPTEPDRRSRVAFAEARQERRRRASQAVLDDAA